MAFYTVTVNGVTYNVEKPVDDWTYQESIGAPATLNFDYVDSTGAAKTVSLISTTWSRTYTTYRTLPYVDYEGQQKSEDVAWTVDSFTRSTAAAVNGAYVKWRLDKGLGLPAGDANKESHTDHTYYVNGSGPHLIRKVVDEYISEFELAGSLNIADYTGFTPTAAMVQASRTIYEYEEYTVNRGKTYTKSSTSRYLAWGLTQEGQQAASKQLRDDPGDGTVTTRVFLAMAALVFDGTEVESAIGRAPLPSRPSGQELLADALLGDTEEGDFDGSGSITEQFDYGDGLGEELDYNYYSLPFTPDFYGGLAGKDAAELAAVEYARTLNALKAGYAFGFNITTSADRLPSLPFSPLFINAAGLSVATRINGCSWAFDASGMVASTDLLLAGVAGTIGSVSSSWVRLPVSTAGLPVLNEPTASSSPAPASTITAPSGFDPTDPGAVFELLPTENNDVPAHTQTVTTVVAPYMLISPLLARSRHRAVAEIYDYAVSSQETVALISRHRASAVVKEFELVPAAAITVAALASTETGELSFPVDKATIAVAGLEPANIGDETIVTFNAPAAITVAGLAPGDGSTVVVFNFDGSDGSTSISSSSGNGGTISTTLYGTAALDTSEKKFGTAALYLDGPQNSSGDWMTFNLPQAFGTGDFCVEFWVYMPSGFNHYSTVYSLGAGDSIDVDTSAGGYYFYCDSSPGPIYLHAAAAFAFDQWQHVALYRIANAYYLSVDGVVSAGPTTITVDYNSLAQVVGSWSDSSGVVHGSYAVANAWIDELRVTIGNAVYGPSNFTPPAAPF